MANPDNRLLGACALALMLVTPVMAQTDQSAAQKRQALFAAAMNVFNDSGCEPVIGYLTRVFPDPTFFQTDLRLDDVLQTANTHDLWGRNPVGTTFATIRAGNEATFPDIKSFAGHDVVIWVRGAPDLRGLYWPGQIQLLSSALANPGAFCRGRPSKLGVLGPSPRIEFGGK